MQSGPMFDRLNPRDECGEAPQQSTARLTKSDISRIFVMCGDEAEARIMGAVVAELKSASKWPPFNSAHEGYGVLLEEMDELKAHIWTRQDKRDLAAMRAEAIQVAAMAVKFVEMIDAGRGRV